jgi:Ankyrin repeats (many copies)
MLMRLPLVIRVLRVAALLCCVQAAAAELDDYRKAIVAGDATQVVALMRGDSGRTPLGGDGESILHIASWRAPSEHRIKMLRAMLAAGAAVDARDNHGSTTLRWVAGADCVECVELLLKAGAQVMARNEQGSTPLHNAGPLTAPLLIAAGADVAAADAQGNRALHRRFHAAFLSVGVNVRNAQGFTPLHFAALRGDEQGLRWLLAQGADPLLQSTAPYEHRDGLSAAWGREPVYTLPAGSRPYDLAAWQHERNKYATGAHRTAMELLDKLTPRRSLWSR